MMFYLINIWIFDRIYLILHRFAIRNFIKSDSIIYITSMRLSYPSISQKTPTL